MAELSATSATGRPAWAVPVLLLGGLFAVLVYQSLGAASNDLRALWLAGVFYGEGVPGVYAQSVDVFGMQPPEAWAGAARTGQPTYPFIYPPIWAALMAEATRGATFETFAAVAGVVNAGLITASFVMAWRIAGQPRADVFFLIGVGIGLTSLVFILPMRENQPQILVSFLILLGIERERSDRQMAAGLAMALAAAIKVYPVIFALFWLAAGRRAATVWFAVFGGALGAVSIAVTGWPMHAAFLHELSVISGTVLLSLANFSLDPLIAALFIGPDAMTWVDTNATGGGTRWLVYEKPALWRAANVGLLGLAVLALAMLARRTRLADPLFWPLALVAVAWLSPLSWFYHYMTAFYLLPMFFFRLGAARGGLIVLLAVLPSIPTAYFALQTIAGSNAGVVVVINASLVLIAVASFIALERGASGIKG